MTGPGLNALLACRSFGRLKFFVLEITMKFRKNRHGYDSRVGMNGEEIAQVLVTVKTYPSPSDKYGETVCMEGVRLDGDGPSWIRLYPMVYRLAEEEQRYRKYEIIKIPIAKHPRDNRPESFRPNQDSLEVVDKIGTNHNWAKRKKLLGDLIGATTTCDLIRANKANNPFSVAVPSLGLVKMLNPRVSVERGDPWDDKRLAKAIQAAQPDLFNPEGVKQLEPAPYKVKLSYRCESQGCAGHNPAILDWEAGQAGRRFLRKYGHAEGMGKLRQKYEDLTAPGIDAHLYVGNIHQYPHSFSGLGIWSPEKDEEAELYESDLFGG